MRQHNESAEVATISTDGARTETLITMSGFLGDWFPKGDKILVYTNPGDGSRLYSLTRETHQLKELIPSIPLRMYIRYPHLSPDGNRLLYEFNESTGNVFMAELGIR